MAETAVTNHPSITIAIRHGEILSHRATSQHINLRNLGAASEVCASAGLGRGHLRMMFMAKHFQTASTIAVGQEMMMASGSVASSVPRFEVIDFAVAS